jgi:antitoxin ParD1/3/4
MIRDKLMTMHRKTITLTDKLESWVKIQVDSGKFGNDSEYFRDLVRRDQERQEAETRLRNLLDDAEASGISERNPQEIWAAAEASSPVNNG